MIKPEDIRDALGEMLDEISDPGLRAKVVDAWMLAVREGGWGSMEHIRQMPFTLVTDTRGIGFVDHTLAVTRSAVGLARAQKESYRSMPYEIDMDRLIAGGLLHDVGKLLEARREGDGSYSKSHSGRCCRHPISGAVIAGKAGLPNEIINIIACHSVEGDGRPKVIETVLIHQADFAAFDPLVMMATGALIQP